MLILFLGIFLGDTEYHVIEDGRLYCQYIPCSVEIPRGWIVDGELSNSAFLRRRWSYWENISLVEKPYPQEARSRELTAHLRDGFHGVREGGLSQSRPGSLPGAADHGGPGFQEGRKHDRQAAVFRFRRFDHPLLAELPDKGSGKA